MPSTDRSEFMAHLALFKWKPFQPEIILLNVRWYCRYAYQRQGDVEISLSRRGFQRSNLGLSAERQTRC